MGSETTGGLRGTSPAAVPDPDLKLVVRVEPSAGGLRLTYELHFGNRRFDSGVKPLGSVLIADDPAAYLKDLIGEIEQLRTKGEQSLTRRRLGSIGATLLELFPYELQRRLWTIHERVLALDGPAPTLCLVSDESWLPWELLRLRDPDGKPQKGVYLAEMFAFTRWLRGPAETIAHPFSNVAVVAPKKSGLAQTAGEQKMLRKRDGEDGRRVTAIEPATYERVTQELESGRFDGWHFAGHGLPQGNDPNLWAFRLENRESLKPVDLAEVDFQGRRPLVFMNSCHGSRGGLTLTGIGGWAETLVKVRAGAFIGAYWEVSDGAAMAFAEAFYERFLGGEPLGEAARGARIHVRKEFPGDPTWAAYTVYGHPLATSRAPASDTTLETDEETPKDAEKFLEKSGTAAQAVSAKTTPVPHSRAAVIGVAAVVCLLALLVAVWWIRSRDPLPPETPSPNIALVRPAVAVLSFDDVSDTPASELDWLGTALAEALSVKLGLGGDRRVVERLEVYLMELGGDSNSSRASSGPNVEQDLERISQVLGADYVVAGEYSDIGGSLQLDLILFDWTGRQMATGTAIGESENWLRLVDRASSGFREALEAPELSTLQVDQLTARFPATREAAELYTRSLAQRRRFRLKDAYALLTAAAEAEEHFFLQLELARVALDLGDKPAAEAALAKAQQLARDREGTVDLSERERLSLELATSLLDSSWTGFVAAYEGFLARYSDDIDIGLYLADAMAESDRPERAVSVLRDLRKLPLAEHHPKIDLIEALAFNSLEDYGKAVESARRSLANASALDAVYVAAQARITLAISLSEMGAEHQQEANALFHQARAGFGKVGDFLGEAQCLELNAAMYEEFDKETAAKLYHQAITEIYPKAEAPMENARAHYRLSLVLLAQGKGAEAEAAAAKAGELAGDRFWDNMGYFGFDGFTLHLEGRLEAARREYEAAKTILDRGNTRVAYGVFLTNLGEIAYLQGDFERAENLHGLALSIHSGNEALEDAAYDAFRLGKVAAARGRYQMARRHYQQAMPSLDPSEIWSKGDAGIAGEVTLALAEIELFTGRSTDALARLESAWQQLPELGDLGLEARFHAALARVQLERGNREAAKAAVAEALENADLDFRARYLADITEARVLAADEDVDTALQKLGEITREAAGDEARNVLYELESLLAAGRIELDSGRVEAGRNRLQEARRRAEEIGFGQLVLRVSPLLDAGNHAGPR